MAVGDSLTASTLITDDARFCKLDIQKIEVTDWTGASILIETLDEWRRG